MTKTWAEIITGVLIVAGGILWDIIYYQMEWKLFFRWVKERWRSRP